MYHIGTQNLLVCYRTL
ncbi:uncharacterized protein DMAD_13618 [Drosophila madeirensis]|uniref:Uncharacterized protein n=1 Tax=Drosophila madeirensis TaxID=30013 RepID=A0AAU9GFU2_DROMD